MTCKNIHNFDEVPSIVPNLCKHCWYIEVNKLLNKNKLGELECDCGCNGVCPECDNERFVEYVRGDSSHIDGCCVCNSKGEYCNDDDNYDDYNDRFILRGSV